MASPMRGPDRPGSAIEVRSARTRPRHDRLRAAPAPRPVRVALVDRRRRRVHARPAHASPARICGPHHDTALMANMPGRRNVHCAPDASISDSIRACRPRSGLGCWNSGCGVLCGDVSSTTRRPLIAMRSSAASTAAGGAVQTRKTASTPSSAASSVSGRVRSPEATSTPGGTAAGSGRRLSTRTGVPVAASWSSTGRPMWPVAPTTRIRSVASGFRVLPVLADPDVDRQRHAERRPRLPSAPSRSPATSSTASARASISSSSWTVRIMRARVAQRRERVVQIDHRALEDVGGRALDRHVHGDALGGRAQHAVAAQDVRARCGGGRRASRRCPSPWLPRWCRRDSARTAGKPAK